MGRVPEHLGKEQDDFVQHPEPEVRDRPELTLRQRRVERDDLLLQNPERDGHERDVRAEAPAIGASNDDAFAVVGAAFARIGHGTHVVVVKHGHVPRERADDAPVPAS